MSDVLWRAEEAASATGGEALGDWCATGISIDSRTLRPGDLFIALSDARDGHDFIPDARRNGAAAVMASRRTYGAPALIVDDPADGLTRLARQACRRCSGTRVAITGSVGKTSLKEMCARIFRAHGRAHWSARSYNNHWGVPLSLASMAPETERAVFEIGMNKPGEIDPLARLIRPHCALVTGIAEAHLEGLGHIEDIASEKAAIFSGLEPGGDVLLPVGDRFFDFLKQRAMSAAPTCRVYGFGRDAGDAHLVECSEDAEGQVCVGQILGERTTFRLAAHGVHWSVNALAALLLACVNGLRLAQAAEALSGFSPPPGRGRTHRLALPTGGHALLLDDSYNANPASMSAALESLEHHGRRKLALLSQMLELGPQSGNLHAALADSVRRADLDHLFLFGPGLDPLAEALGSRQTAVLMSDDESALIDAVMSALTDGDILLVKGSHGSGAWRLAEILLENGKEQVDAE